MMENVARNGQRPEDANVRVTPSLAPVTSPCDRTEPPAKECVEHCKTPRNDLLLTSAPPPQPQRATSNVAAAATRAVFKKSHTCGSLFAKCSCNNESRTGDDGDYNTNGHGDNNYAHIDDTDRKRLLQDASANLHQLHAIDVRCATIKRSSSPAILVKLNNSGRLRKRLSNPDLCLINANNNCKTSDSCEETVITKQVYLNHPEINFPITVEIPQQNGKESDRQHQQRVKSKRSCDTIVPNRLTDDNSANVNHSDRHKRTVVDTSSLADTIKAKEDQASKFLKDFGIFGPIAMGNGASAAKSATSTSDAEVLDRIRKSSKIMCVETKKNHHQPEDYEYLKSLAPRLEKELSELEMRCATVETELTGARKELSYKDNQILRLQREIHKLKSVLQQTTPLQNDCDILSSLQEKHAMANRVTTAENRQPCANSSNASNTSWAKKQGVSAESSDGTVQQPGDIPITRYEKDFRSKQLIKEAIMDNDFLKNLDSCQIREIVDSMYQREFVAGSYVIREGEAGAHLYVSAVGVFDVIKDDHVLGHMGPGKAFGELAVLYNCTRTASIRVVVDSKVWVLDRKVFQQIMVRTGLQRLQDNINFLKSVPLLQNLSNDVLAKIADVLEVEFYPAGAYIIRQGANGDTFFIISSGNVKITQRMTGRLEEEEIRTLERGDYFGEQALLKEDCRTASVIAMSPGVECLTLDRDSFIQLIGDLSEIKEKSYGDEGRGLCRPFSSANLAVEPQEYEYIKLDDLDVVATLGVGGFGRVELVQYTHDNGLTFALKCLKKQHIVDTQQQEHVLSERNIMMTCRSPFICRLYRTFRDTKYVYMLLEACLGGEVWTILRDRGSFDDHTTRFVTACVVEAFDYLHARGIVYRDLKPENLLLDGRGYVKLVDFGFSKRLGYSSKTWTFCGTPEYVAPETILNKGHDRAVDYWALGILMYELLTGNPPFSASDPMRTYKFILKGIDMIDFARHHVGRSAQSLIKKLCREAPSERLGYQRGGIQDIKKHKWFQGFDWDGLKARTLTAPIVQPVRGPCDTSNFDCFSKDNDVPPDESSDWDVDF